MTAPTNDPTIVLAADHVRDHLIYELMMLRNSTLLLRATPTSPSRARDPHPYQPLALSSSACRQVVPCHRTSPLRASPHRTSHLRESRPFSTVPWVAKVAYFTFPRVATGLHLPVGRDMGCLLSLLRGCRRQDSDEARLVCRNNFGRQTLLMERC